MGRVQFRLVPGNQVFTEMRREIGNRNRLTDLENELVVTKRWWQWGGIVQVFGIDMYTLLHLKCSKPLLYSTGNSAYCSIIT